MDVFSFSSTSDVSNQNEHQRMMELKTGLHFLVNVPDEFDG